MGEHDSKEWREGQEKRASQLPPAKPNEKSAFEQACEVLYCTLTTKLAEQYAQLQILQEKKAPIADLILQAEETNKTIKIVGGGDPEFYKNWRVHISQTPNGDYYVYQGKEVTLCEK